ncbi:MAG TPA: CDP-alcohol phosphatidyltransferase family protein [Verrucomicrobiae bacterium]|nr:CDP-alcohol phosphatidyltransferase family protein [Verrucomicrobiae bacterium]
MIDPIKRLVRSVMHVLARCLDTVSGGRFTPNGVTLFGLFAHIPIAWLIAMRYNYWAAGLLLVFGLFDTLDGELARLQKRESPEGGLLDSVTDRMKEILLYAGAGYAIIASTGRPYLAVWAVIACGCGLLTSYVNAAGDVAMAKVAARGHVVNKGFRGGLFPFEIRMFILFVGLLSNQVTIAVIVIAIGAAYTSLSRLLRVLKKLTEAHA